MSHRRWLVTVPASLAAHGIALLLLLVFRGVVLPPALVVDLAEGVWVSGDRDAQGSGRPTESESHPGGAESARIRHHRFVEIGSFRSPPARTNPSSSHPPPKRPDTGIDASGSSRDPSRLSGPRMDSEERSPAARPESSPGGASPVERRPLRLGEGSLPRPTLETEFPAVQARHDEGATAGVGGSAPGGGNRRVAGVESLTDWTAGSGQKALGGIGPGRGRGGMAEGSGQGLALGTTGSSGAGAAPQYGPYLARLRRLIQEALRYPPAARRRGLTGTVQLEITMLPNGAIDSVLLLRSSSHPILDEAALDAVRALPPLPFPAGLDARSLTVRLPVVFELQ